MTEYASTCCSTGLTAAGRTTNYYVCRRCRKPCDSRPASMLQPVTFSGDGEDEARRVPMRAVDEAEDEW